MRNAEFWHLLDELAAGSEIIYPLDYGYLAGTTSTDGEGIDVWLGSGGARDLRAILVSVDMDKRDSEIKLLLGLSESEIALVYDFYNKYDGMKAILLRRGEET